MIYIYPFRTGLGSRAEREGTFGMNWIEVNGTSLRCELNGSGATTLVLVHEMGGTLESSGPSDASVGRHAPRAALRHAWCRAIGEAWRPVDVE